MWHKVADLIIKYRLFILITVVLITGYMAYRASFVQMEYKMAVMLPETDSISIQYREFKEIFGEDGTLMVVGFQDTNLFEIEKFNDLISLIDTLKSIEGVKNVTSVANAVNLITDRQERVFKAEKIFIDKFDQQSELDSLRDIFMSLPFYKNLLYNDSSNFYLMALNVEKDKINSNKRFDFVDNLESIISEFGEKHQLKIRYSGLPYTRTRISEMIKSELLMFIFLAMLVTAFILWFLFRSFRVVLFSLFIVGSIVVWALGTMDIFGYQITILTGMIPPLMIVIGIPNCVFLLNKYHNAYSEKKNKIKALKRMIIKMGSPIFLTNLTTAAGFATFMVTQNRILTEFGLIASLNIMGLFVISMLLIPVLFSYNPPPLERHTKHLDSKIIEKIISSLCTITMKYRKTVYISVGIFLVLAGIGISLMHTTGYIIDDIPSNHPVKRDLKIFEEHFKGIMPFEIMIDTKKRKGVLSTSTLKRIDKLQDELGKYPELSKSLSIADGIKFVRQAYFRGNQRHYKIPGNREKSFIFSYLPKGESPENLSLLNSIVDSGMQKARVTLNVGDVGTTKMDALQQKIQAEVDSIFPPDRYDTIVTGSSIVFTKGTEHLIHNLFTSLLLAVLLISIFMAFMFSSLRMILISIVPNILPLLFTAAVMGYAGIAIKPSTVLVFSIAFGISVDNAIHFLAKYRQELEIFNWDIKKSVLEALKETGVSILYTAGILFFGFAIFALSEFGGTVALGILISITLFVAMFANLILLPSLLLSLERFLTTKAFKEPFLQFFDEEEDIELEKLEIKDECS